MNGYRWLPYFVIFRFAIELRYLFFQISKKETTLETLILKKSKRFFTVYNPVRKSKLCLLIRFQFGFRIYIHGCYFAALLQKISFGGNFVVNAYVAS